MAPKSQYADDVFDKLKQMTQESEEMPAPEVSESGCVKPLSDEEIQRALRERYLSDLPSFDEEPENEYALDEAFLREVNAKTEEETKTPSVEKIPEQVEEDDVPWEEEEVPVQEEVVPAQEETLEVQDATEEESVADAAEESSVEIDTLVEEETEILEHEELEVLDEEEPEALEEEVEEDLLSLLENMLEEDVHIEREVLFDDVPHLVSLDEDEDDVTFPEEPEMHPLELDLAEPEIEDEPSLKEEGVKESDVEPSQPQIDPSIVDLLLQFGSREELEENVSEEQIYDYFAKEGCDVPYDFSDSYAEPREEYVTREQNFEIEQAYQKKFVRSLIQLGICATLAFVVLLYDLLPLFRTESVGFFDYLTHPVAYCLFGLQLLLLCFIPVIPQIWNSIKNLLRLKPDLYAVAFCSFFAVALHDLSLLQSPTKELPTAFHAYAAIILLVAVISDHLLLCRERSTFRVYSMEGKAFTLLKDEGRDSVAEKMYRGGLDRNQQVRTFADVPFPNCYFRAVSEKDKPLPVLQWIALPAILLSILCGVCCMLLGRDVFSSLTAIFIALLAALPISMTLVESLWLYLSAHRLLKRKSAIAGKAAIEHYADANIMVFSDRHLFVPCNYDDVGMVFYDQTKAPVTLGALQALYREIGGPMANLFDNVPEHLRPSSVKILRVLRNGVEAVMDRTNLLIVGDHAFMERYGFTFPKDENDRKNRLTLCVSLNGAITAKLNIRYTIEPIFEVICERLAEERIFCAVETKDPLMNGKMVANLRTRGKTPISIVHQTARERGNPLSKEKNIQRETTGILSLGSRLRLAEVLIYCKKLLRLRSGLAWQSALACAVSFVGISALILFGLCDWYAQYLMLAFQVLFGGFAFALGFFALPGKKHFTLESWDKQQRKIKKQPKNKHK